MTITWLDDWGLDDWDTDYTQADTQAVRARAIREGRARELLLTHLTPCQRESYTKAGFFFVRGRNDDVYLLYTGWSVALFHDDRPVLTYGFYPRDDGGAALPAPDCLLAQKLLLETDPWKAMSISCKLSPWLSLPNDYSAPLARFRRECPPHTSAHEKLFLQPQTPYHPDAQLSWRLSRLARLLHPGWPR